MATTIETKKLLKDFKLDDETDVIYDCQFHYDQYDLIGFSTINGDVKLLKFPQNFDDTNQKPTIVHEWKQFHNKHPVRKLRFHNERMFTISKSIKITDLNTQQLLRKITNGSRKIYSLLIIDDYLLCIGDDDGQFKCYDYRCERPCHIMVNECSNFISDMDYDENKQLVYMTSGEGTLTAINIRRKRLEPPQSELFDSSFQSVRYLEDKDKIVVGSEDGVLNIFNANDNQWGNISDRYPIRQNNFGHSSIDCLEVIDDGENMLTFGTSDGQLEFISLFPHRHLETIVVDQQTKSNSIECLDVNQVTKRIVCCTENLIHLYEYNIVKQSTNNGQTTNHDRQHKQTNKKFKPNTLTNNDFFNDLI